MVDKDSKITVDIQLPSLDYTYTKKTEAPEAEEESPSEYGFQETTGIENHLVLVNGTRWYR